MEPLNVLLVDDDVDFGAMMKIRLSREAPQISFHFAAGGAECLEYLKDNSADCILSDYQMPGMNGMELMRALKERGSEVPFIFLTGQGNEEVARDAFKSGADDYFAKDMGFAHFARIINSVQQAVKKRHALVLKHKAERDWEETFNAMDDLVTLQKNDFTIVRGNQAACKALGKECEDIAGKKCYELFHGTTEPIPDCPALEMLGGKGAVVAHEVTLDDRVYEVKICPVVVGGTSDSFVHIAKDITGRKKAEADLLHAKNFTDAVINCLPGMFYLVDNQGRLVRWNRRYAEAMGKGPDEMKSMNALDSIAEESRALAATKMMAVLMRHEDCADEYYTVDKDGRKAPYLCSGSPVVMDGRTYLVGMAIDITDIKRAEEAVARSNEMLRTILDSVQFGMMVVGRDRTIRMANRAALDLMGYEDQSGIVGRTCHNVVCPSEAGKCPVLDLGMRLDLSERVLLKKGGEKVGILKSVSPIMLGDEEVLLETFVNVSANKTSETAH